MADETFYVNPDTGSDSNDGLTSGNAFAKVTKAVTSCNATAGDLCTILCEAGTYNAASQGTDWYLNFTDEVASKVFIIRSDVAGTQRTFTTEDLTGSGGRARFLRVEDNGQDITLKDIDFGVCKKDYLYRAKTAAVGANLTFDNVSCSGIGEFATSPYMINLESSGGTFGTINILNCDLQQTDTTDTNEAVVYINSDLAGINVKNSTIVAGYDGNSSAFLWNKSDLSMGFLSIVDSTVSGGNRAIGPISEHCPQIYLACSDFSTTRTLSQANSVIQTGYEFNEADAWTVGEGAIALGDIRFSEGWMFKCHSAHSTTAATEPDVGADWKTVWEVWDDIRLTAINCSFNHVGITNVAHSFAGFYGTSAYIDGCTTTGGDVGFSLKGVTTTIKNSSTVGPSPCSLFSRNGGSVSNNYFEAVANGTVGTAALTLNKHTDASFFPDRRVNNNILITHGGSVTDRGAFESDDTLGEHYCDKNIYYNNEDGFITKLGGAEKTTIAASQAFYEAQSNAYTQNDQNSKKMSTSANGVFLDMCGDGVKEWVGVPQAGGGSSVSYSSIDGGGYKYTS